jgi:menaquinone-dependent protoporphyrinogen oxidase
MTVLVSYATSGGSIAEIAEWVAEEFRDAGLTVDVRPRPRSTTLRDTPPSCWARPCTLRAGITTPGSSPTDSPGRSSEQPVWLFSSGPLDSSADEVDPPPVHHAAEAMRGLHARGYTTFGGRLSAEARGWLGFLVRRMAGEGHAGDFGNPQRVRAWARGVAAEITSADGEPAAGRSTEAP